MPKVDISRPLVEILKGLGACEEARAWAQPYKTASAAWLKCEQPDWMLWALKKAGIEDSTKLRLFACWCARHTPLTDGRTTWDLLTDERSRNAVEVAERFARGEANEDELAAAWAAARAAQARQLRHIFGNPFRVQRART